MPNELIEQENNMPVQRSTDIILSGSVLDDMAKLAEMMSKSQNALPVDFQGNPDDCLAVVIQAAQWGMNPYAIAQKTHFIKGNISYESQLVNAVINKLAPIEHRIKYEFFGDWNKLIGNVKQGKSGNGKPIFVRNWTDADENGVGVRVYTTIRGESEPRVLELLMSQAQIRNSLLWVSDPKQQLCYLAVKKWSRLHCPDVIMGVYTPDEAMEFDSGEAPIEVEVIDIQKSIGEAKNNGELKALFVSSSADEQKRFRDAFNVRKAELKQVTEVQEGAE